MLKVSLLLFLMGVLVAIKTKSGRYNVIIFCCGIFVFIITSITFVVADYFTDEGINEAVIYHLSYGLWGAGFADFWEIITITITLVLCAAFFSYWLFQKTFSNKSRSYKGRWFVCYLFLFSAFISSPSLSDLLGIYEGDNTLNAIKNFADYFLPGNKQTQKADFYRFYQAPTLYAATDKPRNLIFIYAESLERTYFDEDIFPGLIKGLRDVQAKSTYFTNVYESYGSGWTVGGMISSQCGIPLITSSHGNSMSGMPDFLPGAVCIGDLLQKEGYFLSYLGGASLDFAGKGKLFKTHGFNNVRGYDELKNQLKEPSYTTNWGLYDDTLLDIAYKDFLSLSAKGNKFALFLLTLDTHHPTGHPSKSCKNLFYKDGANPILNAVACSDYLLSRFVNKITHSRYAKESIIVIVSDHLAMPNTATELLKQGERKNLFMIIDPLKPDSRDLDIKAATLDIGPTVLDAMGYKGKIGLGRDLFSTQQPLINKFANFNRVLKGWRNPAAAFWDKPEINEFEINVAAKTVTVENKKYKIPVLMAINEDLTTDFYFMQNASFEMPYYLAGLDGHIPYVWIDFCTNIRRFENRLEYGDGRYCVVAGKLASDYFFSAEIKDVLRMTSTQINALMFSKVASETYQQNITHLLDNFIRANAEPLQQHYKQILLKELLINKIPVDKLELIHYVPNGSSVFLPNNEFTPFIVRYLENPVLNTRQIKYEPVLPLAKEFYFLSDNLDEVNNSERYEWEKADYPDNLPAFTDISSNEIYRAFPKTSAAAVDEFAFHPLRVAHAGGGIDGNTYTNSYEALDYNIKRGYVYFELDFSFTEGGKLVCLHDWKHSFKRSFGFATRRKITLHEFEDLARNVSQYEKCTLDGLKGWLRENPSAIIVTDVKEDNLRALAIIHESIPNAGKRVIPQIYQPQNYELIKNMGYRQIIWTLYRYQGSDEDVLNWVDRFDGRFAVTMPTVRAKTSLPKQLAIKKIPTYVHTVNDTGVMHNYLNNYNVTNVYTDFLPPA